MAPNAIDRKTLISDVQMGELLSHLSAAELKVLLYLTVQGHPGTITAGAHPEDGFPLREIADGTHLTKKQVRHALRLLSINATYYNRFQ